MDLEAREFGGITSDNVRGHISSFRCICKGESSFHPASRIRKWFDQSLSRISGMLCRNKYGRFAAAAEDEMKAS